MYFQRSNFNLSQKVIIAIYPISVTCRNASDKCRMSSAVRPRLRLGSQNTCSYPKRGSGLRLWTIRKHMSHCELLPHLPSLPRLLCVMYQSKLYLTWSEMIVVGFCIECADGNIISICVGKWLPEALQKITFSGWIQLTRIAVGVCEGNSGAFWVTQWGSHIKSAGHQRLIPDFMACQSGQTGTNLMIAHVGGKSHYSLFTNEKEISEELYKNASVYLTWLY